MTLGIKNITYRLIDVRLRCNMEETGRVDCVETITKRYECATLWQQHKETV